MDVAAGQAGRWLAERRHAHKAVAVRTAAEEVQPVPALHHIRTHYPDRLGRRRRITTPDGLTHLNRAGVTANREQSWHDEIGVRRQRPQRKGRLDQRRGVALLVGLHEAGRRGLRIVGADAPVSGRLDHAAGLGLVLPVGDPDPWKFRMRDQQQEQPSNHGDHGEHTPGAVYPRTESPQHAAPPRKTSARLLPYHASGYTRRGEETREAEGSGALLVLLRQGFTR